MNNLLDRLQKAWQSQSCQELKIDPDRLLTVARLERRIILLSDIVVILILLLVGILMLFWSLRDIDKNWPWLIYSATDAWVIGFILLNQWRRRRHAPHYEEPLLAHVEWSIKDIEHRMWLERSRLWWYTLPIALGCMIPPTISFVMDCIRKPQWVILFASLFALLVSLGVFAAIFAFIHRVIKNRTLVENEARRQELQALRTLRESLLNTEEPHI
jgi:ABC-type multidrug transport system fused ATPase/permease subunit